MGTALEGKVRFEAEGLHVSCNTANSLWIAANVRDMGEGIRLSDDACSLLEDENGWVAVFPAEGLLTYEVPGTLDDLVPLILAVYSKYRSEGGPFRDVLKSVVTDSEQYLVGRSLTRV